MPQFKIRCINAATGDLYEIEREGAHYEQARLRAIKDGHEIAPSKPISTAAPTPTDSDPASMARVIEQLETANSHLKSIEKTTSMMRSIIIWQAILFIVSVVIGLIAAK